ncbi:SusC/RagA family TonB-linked outer membrane protein [Pseudoflavitalea sp. G-6-1-2]|uniref:SusC/RagA family TonB-linked outer membrane protein n=1 Tax=Pseudoflavitalea sp. G-6-1-2 TaxID=2728841 RepID=UPI00146CB03F|nr:SusC/RagA family TonB-linked outer membrane protein [Pseudoflavitalea sp. G-6-1-2]NML23640.1 SusC/RagA family TonB-linked outer membrane protein [Pseudoflavitalea sp. G-6-1-2]
MKKQITRTLLLVILMAWSVAGFSQSVSLKGSDVPVEKLFDEIKKQTGFSFFYPANALKGARPVNIDITNTSLKAALELICKGQPFTYNINGKIITISLIPVKRSVSDSTNMENGSSREQLITGRITSREGQPLAGATIRVKGKSTGGKSADDGRYSITAEANDQLIVTYVNYKQDIISIKGRKVIDVILEANISAMDEVTISTGYQRIEQKYMTGAVTRLKMDSLYQPGITTVDKMLEGRVPGLIMMQNSGQAGAAPKLRIRGTSTILGSREPIWVVDGIVQTDPVPIEANRINDYDFVNLVGNAISGLNPNDIENISVLKDAAATAMYGVRAANGVIVVTTKRGKSGPATVSYSNNITYTRRPRYTDNDVYMMNSQERIDVSKEMFDRQIPTKGVPEAYEKAMIAYYNGEIDYATYLQRVNRAKTMNTDWLGAVTQDVLSSNQTLGISGGSAQSSYYASVGYTNERGVIKGEYSKRYTGLLKLNLNYRNFLAQFSIVANRNDRRYTPENLGILKYAYGTSRAIPLYKEKDSLYFYAPTLPDGTTSLRPAFNVLNEMNHSGQTVEGNSYTFTGNLNYQLVQGLQLKAVLSYTASNTEQRKWYDEKTSYIDQLRSAAPGDPSSNAIPFGGELWQQNNRVQAYTMRGDVEYSRYADARKKHFLNAMLGTELSSSKNSALAQTRRGYYPERGYSFAQINLATYTAYANWLQNSGQPTITEGLTNLASVYASASYIYDDRYVLTANARSDYSNAFGSRSNERFMPTWVISARWNMEKDLLKNLQWVNTAALRLSYGTQGNMLQNQTPYAIIQKGDLIGDYGAFGSTIAYLPNPYLRWEKTDNYDAGIDFSLLNGRLVGSVGVFYKKTTNAFLTRSVSVVNGVNYYTVNGGDLENKGIELSFNFTPINNAMNGGKKGLIWRIDPQLGQVFNKILDRALGNNRLTLNANEGENINYTTYLNGDIPTSGKPVGTFYAYRFKSIDNKGVPVFYGAEPENAAALEAKYSKMSTEDIFREVMTESGRREPVLQGSISNYLAYGNWSLNLNFTYSLGNKIRLLKIASGEYGTFQPSSQQNLRKEYVDRWRYPGDETKTTIPGLFSLAGNERAWWGANNAFALDYFQMYDYSDLRVVSGDYLKLQSAALNYNCPPELCKRYRLKAARISLSGSNLVTWAHKEMKGQDPTQSGTSPNINLSIRPVYALSINVSF